MKRIYKVITIALAVLLIFALLDFAGKVKDVAYPQMHPTPRTFDSKQKLNPIVTIPTQTPIKEPPTFKINITLPTLPPTNGTMFSGPSVMPEDIESILSHYKSPAMGNGKVFFALGLKYGIDPAYMLAFFAKESTFGTDPNWRKTNNIGNIICTKNWKGNCSGRFRVYNTWAESAEDWYSLMQRKYKGLDIYQIIAIYAPSSDGNNSNAYTKSVLAFVSKWRKR